MKKIKKLQLKSGQKLNDLQQQFVVAAGYGDWQYNCHCTKVGHSHMETCQEQITSTDLFTLGIGALLTVTGSVVGVVSAVCEFPTAGLLSTGIVAGVGLQGAGIAMMGDASKTLTVTWTRTMRCTKVNPLTHTQISSSVTSTLL